MKVFQRKFVLCSGFLKEPKVPRGRKTSPLFSLAEKNTEGVMCDFPVEDFLDFFFFFYVIRRVMLYTINYFLWLLVMDVSEWLLCALIVFVLHEA